MRTASSKRRPTCSVPSTCSSTTPRNASFKGKAEIEYTWFRILDSLPGISIDADRAARQLVSAVERGSAHVVLSGPGKLGAFAAGIAPSFVANALAFVAAILPDDANPRAMRGAETGARIPRWITLLDDRAAERNNETLAPS
jgi:hypothetical protein